MDPDRVQALPKTARHRAWSSNKRWRVGSLTPHRDRDGSYRLGVVLTARIDERGNISAMELKPNVVEVAWERRGEGFLRRGGGASEGSAEGAGASAITRRRDRPKPVCDRRRAGGGGRSGDASQGQTEVHMA